MQVETAISKFPNLTPTINPPTRVELRGASGAGFAFGQMLARMHSSDRSHPIVVVRRFMPVTINDEAPTTAPWAYQSREFKPDVNQMAAGWVYVIVDVETNSVGGTHCRVRHLTPAEGEDDVVLNWHSFNPDRFRLDDETGYWLTILTGLAYKGKAPRAPQRQLINFPDADSVDMDRSMLPSDAERPESYWIWKKEQRQRIEQEQAHYQARKQQYQARKEQWTPPAHRNNPRNNPLSQKQHKQKQPSRPLNAVRAAFDGVLEKLRAA